MKKLHFETSVQAPASTVSHVLTDDRLFREWASTFHPSSSFEGSWQKGEKILFVGTDEDGKRGGLVSKIVEHIPNQQISILHMGLIDGDKEIMDGPALEGWNGAMEEYFLEERGSSTHLRIALDVHDDFADYFSKSWPEALERIKALAERNGLTE